VEIADLKKKTLVIELLKHHQTTEDEAFDKRHQLGSIKKPPKLDTLKV